MRALVVISLMLGLPLPALAVTLQVGPGQAHPTIQGAIDAANDGDILAINPGTYDGALLIDGKDLTLSGIGAAELRATDDSLLRVENATITIINLTFRPDGGRALRLSEATATVRGSTFVGNGSNEWPYNGGAIAVYDGSTLLAENTTFRDNRSSYRFFSGFEGYGGAIYITDGDATFQACTFTGNQGSQGGAIHHAGEGTTTVRATTFTDQSASDRGGAIFVSDDANLVVEDSTFTNNRAPLGGAVRWQDGAANTTATLARNTFTGHRADNYGGVIATNGGGTLDLRDNRMIDSGSAAGGAMSLVGLEAVVAYRNLICNADGSTEAAAVRISHNGTGDWQNNTVIDALTAGGGSGGAFFVVDSEAQSFRNNTVLDARTTRGRGGAFWIDDSPVTLRNNLVAWSSAGHGVDAAAAAGIDINWGGWFSNTPADVAGALSRGANAVLVDPGLLAYQRNNRCDDDDVRLAPGSPLRDAGDPALLDPDGSRSDIGAWGGPEAPPYRDADGDGVVSAYDCNDNDNTVYPGRAEACDGKDNDCNSLVDDNPPGAPTWFPDADGDGAGATAGAVAACTAPAGHVGTGGDCDDNNNAVRPTATERCNGVDDNCDGRTDGSDSADLLTWYADADGDGIGAASPSTAACAQPDGYVLPTGDCDDTNADVRPNTDERCNGFDDNCDGSIDGDDAVDRITWFGDDDGDGWGGNTTTTLACTRPDGAWGRADSDCDDGDSSIHPYATESCTDTTDRNCDGAVGDADNDGDGWRACEDCDDFDATIRPDAEEVWYDGILQNCSTRSDFDADADGFESGDHGGDDCDDTDPAVYPGAPGRPLDGIDADCDGELDVDPFVDEDVRAACGCATANPNPGLLLAMGMLLLARRRSRS